MGAGGRAQDGARDGSPVVSQRTSTFNAEAIALRCLDFPVFDLKISLSCWGFIEIRRVNSAWANPAAAHADLMRSPKDI